VQRDLVNGRLARSIRRLGRDVSTGLCEDRGDRGAEAACMGRNGII
jgi:hypothetical protein